MNIYAFLLFGAFIITGFTFTYILAQKNNNVENLSYLLIAGFIEIWTASDFIVSTKIIISYDLIILKLFSFSWLFIGVIFINFVYVFNNIKKNWVYYLLFVCAGIFSFLAVFTDWIYTGVEASSWGIIEKRGILYEPAGFLLVVFPIVYSFVILIIEYSKMKDLLRKKQTIILAMGSVISIVIGIITDMILPKLLHGFMITGSFSAVFLSLFVYRAVTKYRFLLIPLEESVYEVFLGISDGVILLNKQDEIIQINPAASKILGLENRFCQYKNIKEILSLPEFDKAIKDKELRYKNLRNEESFLMISVTPIYKPNFITSKIIIIHDISELKKRTEELEKLNKIIFKASITDVLTGLYNRQELYKRIEEEINRMERHPKIAFSILFIDLDNFKYYNDTYGHPIGDIMLQEFSIVLKECVRVIDFICRFGGDEFVIILPETDTQRASQVAERIHMEIENKNYFKEIIESNIGYRINIPEDKLNSCSIGIAQFDSDHIVNAEELIIRADRALYQAKRSKKGGYVLWEPGMKQSLEITEIVRR